MSWNSWMLFLKWYAVSGSYKHLYVYSGDWCMLNVRFKSHQCQCMSCCIVCACVYQVPRSLNISVLVEDVCWGIALSELHSDIFMKDSCREYGIMSVFTMLWLVFLVFFVTSFSWVYSQWYDRFWLYSLCVCCFLCWLPNILLWMRVYVDCRIFGILLSVVKHIWASGLW